MRIALVGATGATGAPILNELVARRHTVVAIVRGDRGLSAPSVTPVTADAEHPASLVAAFAGVEAVVSAFNPGWTEADLYEKFMRGARNIQRATRDAGVARLLVVGGAASLYGADGRQLIDEMTIPEPYAAGVRAARDYHAEILGEAELDWVFLSPPPEYGPVGPTVRLGRYRTAADTPGVDDDGHSSISGPDLALAVVDELETPRHHRERFTIGY